MFFLKNNQTDNIYNENGMGPKMEPWGIPQVRIFAEQ